MARSSSSGSALSALYAFGMLLVFVGERLIASGTWRATSAVGLALVIGAFVMRWVRVAGAPSDRRQAEQLIAALYGVGLFTIVLYGLSSDLGPAAFRTPKATTIIAALWPAIWLPHAFALLLIQLAVAEVWRAPTLELGRVHAALGAGLGLGAAIVFAFTVVYIGSERNARKDFSYFRTARAGESTHKIVKGLDAPVTVYLFFPPGNEVADQVTQYFDDLKSDSTQLTVTRLDQPVDVVKAKEVNVNANGSIVFVRDKRKEPLYVGVELDTARGTLRNLDKEVQKRLLQVSRPARTVYLVTGHEERSTDNVGEGNRRATIRELREGLGNLGYVLKNLGAVEGLGQDVPTDASVVLWLGPQKPLLPEEAASLQRYFEKGGRLLLALDPDAGVDGGDLAKSLGVKLRMVPLASDQAAMRYLGDLSDRGRIATLTFSSHPAVTTLQKLASIQPTPVILPTAGSLEEQKDRAKGLAIDIIMRAHQSTWDDQDNNFKFDPPTESRKPWELAAAITKKGASGKADDESRAIVIADSDVFSDGPLEVKGNQQLLVDALRWLVGEEAIQGETNTETDVPILHTKGKDSFWFYSTVVLMPALIIAVGALVTRGRRRSSGSRKAKSGNDGKVQK